MTYTCKGNCTLTELKRLGYDVTNINRDAFIKGYGRCRPCGYYIKGETRCPCCNTFISKKARNNKCRRERLEKENVVRY